MAMLSDDPFADLGPAKKPCGCKDKAASGATDFEELPDAAELEQALDGLEADNGDPELAELEGALQELEGGGDASLEDLVALAGRYPGLKVTISY
jgi:hypothetical protein